MREGPNVEFKREWSDGVKKTMVAFANTDGGSVYIGVSDDGEVVGLDNPDACVVKAMQAASNAIRPDITLCTHAEVVEREGREIVEIQIQRGTSRPYYLGDKGVRPAGVFVRQGAMTAPASESAILSMIKESSNDVFDAERSVEQNLTFAEAERFFEQAGIVFGEQQWRTLGFVDEFGTFTNTGMLFSDQCSATLKGAVFQGETKDIFKNRFEFSGSILRQFQEAMEFVNRYNAVHSEVGDDMRRIDSRDYPVNAVREALLNMFIHRDYSVPAPALMSVFDNRIEFVNFGGLVRGMSTDDLFLGVSLQRNPHVASVFYRLKLVEAYGTGIPKIVDSYRSTPFEPALEVASNSFKVTLPSLTSAVEAVPNEAVGEGVFKVGLQEAKVLECLAWKTAISRAEVESLLGLSRSSAGELLASMEGAGLIRKVGSGKNTRYVRS